MRLSSPSASDLGVTNGERPVGAREMAHRGPVVGLSGGRSRRMVRERVNDGFGPIVHQPRRWMVADGVR